MTDALPVVYLARHGETAWTISHQHTGLTDLPLTPNGEAQARRLGARLEGMKLAAVFTSPLQRAVRTARQDYSSLAEAASLYSVQLWDIPQAIRKAQDEARTARRVREQLDEELAEQLALRILADTPVVNGRKVVVKIYDDRDLSFIKLLGQKLTRSETGVIALLAAMQVQPAVVFVQSQGQPFDMGAFMKQALAKLGGRGGGSKDMAQGGPQQLGELPSVLEQLADKIRNA